MKYEYIILYSDNTWVGSNQSEDVKQELINRLDKFDLKSSEMSTLLFVGGCGIGEVENAHQLLIWLR